MEKAKRTMQRGTRNKVTNGETWNSGSNYRSRILGKIFLQLQEQIIAVDDDDKIWIEGKDLPADKSVISIPRLEYLRLLERFFELKKGFFSVSSNSQWRGIRMGR